MKKLFRLGMILGFLGLAQTMDAQTISSHYFGVNAWMADTIGDVNNCPDPPCYKNGKLHKQWEKIKDSKATIVRYGGIAPDQNKPTNFQYLRVIDSIRAKGMEPIMQVSYYNNRYTAAEAAALVHYVNVVKGRNVKYWIIANEPNLMYNHTTSAQVAAYFKPFASAMKNADPSILIVGPETASFKKTIIDGLTTPGGPDDITGKDAAGRYYVDVVSFHTYPMQDGLGTRTEAITKLTSANNLQDNLAYLNTRINNCNSYHNRTGSAALKTAVTETNVNYNNSPSDNLYGIGANSFFGGQFVCEIYGIGLKHGVDFINLWSVMEGGSSVINNGGFLDGVTGNKKPLYYHFQMMAGAFKGTSINATGNNVNVKHFACKDAQETTVMVLNEDLATNFNYTIRLDNSAISSSDPLKINVNAGIPAQYSAVIPNQSTVLLTFNSAGQLIKKTEYSLQNHAVANLPPTTTLITPVTAVCNVPSGMNVSAITSAGASLNWNSTGAQSYNVRYKPSTATTWTSANVTGTSYSVSGLTASTSYEFQVAGVCSSTSASAFSASTTFNTTASVCAVPSGLNTSSVTASSATLSWTASGAANYNVRYKALAATTWNTVTSSGTSASITGLAAGTTYEFQVAGVCSTPLSSAFSASKTFNTTTLLCNIPSGLNVSLLTATSATLSWASSGATSYNVRYKAVASTTWTTVNVAALSKAISGLTASTAYEFQVAGVCSANSTSAFSASKPFTTISAVCAVPGGLTVTSIASATATLNWTSTGAASYNVRYKTAVSAYWTTKTTSGTSQNIYGLLAGTDYEFQVMSVCSSTASSAYSASKPFTTAAACPVPAGLNSSLITATTATLSWTSTGAASYNVRYKIPASTTWTAVSSTTNTAALTGLSASTTYEFQVAGVCSGVSSNFSASVQFSTSATNNVVVVGHNNMNTSLTPYAASAVKQHVQMIITKSELIAEGYNATNNMLQSLSFYMSGTSQVLSNFTIKIIHLSGTAFSNNKFISTTGATTVYAANHTTAATGWNQHLFSTPFIYNGTGNILIDITWSNTVPKINAPVKYTPTTSYRTLYYRTSKTSDNLASIAKGTLTYERPNMKLEFSGASRNMASAAEEETSGEDETIAKVTELNMNVYPNPALNDFNISFNVNSGESAKIAIYNIVGDLVEEINYTAEATGKQLVTFDFNSDVKLNSLASGTYICCLDANGKRTSKKFILVK